MWDHQTAMGRGGNPDPTSQGCNRGGATGESPPSWQIFARLPSPRQGENLPLAGGRTPVDTPPPCAPLAVGAKLYFTHMILNLLIYN